MSIVTLRNKKSYWRKNTPGSPFCYPNLGKMIGRNRWDKIWQALHFNDPTKALPPTHRDFDKLFKVKPVVDGLNEAFLEAWSFGDSVSVDEGTKAYKGRTYLRQYMPKKIVKWGFKIWGLACSYTGFCGSFMVEGGVRPGEKARKDLGPTVVRDLVAMATLERGTTVYCDRYFTSVGLAVGLRRKGFHMVGTIVPNRKFIPKEALFGKDERPERGAIKSAVCKKNRLRFLQWVDNEKVCILSTKLSVSKTVASRRKGKKSDGRRSPPPPCFLSMFVSSPFLTFL